jgi:hypothetical protein
LIFRKWLSRRYRRGPVMRTETPVHESWTRAIRAVARQAMTPADDGRVEWTGRLLVWGLLAWFGVQTATTGYQDVVGETAPWSYYLLHRVNLVFHEAGHVLFSPFGDFLMVLGGSLLQVLVPLVVSGAFLFRQANNFGASVGLWWTGQSLADVAVYIRDARELRLQLLGGGTGADRPGWHDWENLLGRLGLLEQERIIAAVVGLSGLALMVLALVWGAALLRGQHRSLG